MSTNRIPGLDSLRFISISFVVLLHLFTFKSNFGFTSYYFPVFELLGGKLAVQFFFCLSGFLLTFLLLAELERNNKINLKSFYIRRVLRILPAYFLLIIISLAVVINIPFFYIPGVTDAYLTGNYKLGNLLYILFLPHIAPFFTSTAPYIHQTYTIGIEEQFYLIWGLLFYFFPKRMFHILLFIVIAAPFLNVLHHLLFISLKSGSNTSLILIKKALFYFQFSRISTFAIGSLFGYAFFLKKRWINLFQVRSVQVLAYIILVLTIIFKIHIPFLGNEFLALLVSCILLIATFGKQSILNLDRKWLAKLGRISYGMYLFHIFAIVFAVKIVSAINLPMNAIIHLLLLIILTLTFSIIFGWLSYHAFEVVFLRLKQRFIKA